MTIKYFTIPLLCILMSTAIIAEEKIYKDVPNLSQEWGLNHNRFCGPVAAMNTMLWLRDAKNINILQGINNNDKIIAFINKLGDEKYMNTTKGNGTSLTNIYIGVEKYFKECGYEITRVDMQSNSVTIGGRPTLSFDSIKKCIDDDKCVIMMIKYYEKKKPAGNLKKVDSHFVTCIGYKVEGDKKEIIFNDPRNKKPGQRHSVSLVESGMRIDGVVVDQKAEGAPMYVDGYLSPEGHIGIIQSIYAYSVIDKKK